MATTFRPLVCRFTQFLIHYLINEKASTLSKFRQHDNVISYPLPTNILSASKCPWYAAHSVGVIPSSSCRLHSFLVASLSKSKNPSLAALWKTSLAIILCTCFSSAKWQVNDKFYEKYVLSFSPETSPLALAAALPDNFVESRAAWCKKAHQRSSKARQVSNCQFLYKISTKTLLN